MLITTISIEAHCVGYSFSIFSSAATCDPEGTTSGRVRSAYDQLENFFLLVTLLKLPRMRQMFPLRTPTLRILPPKFQLLAMAPVTLKASGDHTTMGSILSHRHKSTQHSHSVAHVPNPT